MDREHKLYKDALSGMMPDFEKVRLHAKCRKPVHGGRGFRRWAMPVLSEACAAGLICVLVPPVRASLVSFFHGDSGASTAAYFNIDADGELLMPWKGAERVSYLDYRMGDSVTPTTEGLILVPFPDTEISEIKLIACDLRTGKAITEDAIELIFA